MKTSKYNVLTKKTINTPKSLYKLDSIIPLKIPLDTLADLNACIHKISTGYRLFFRSIHKKYGDDKIYTCVLDDKYTVLSNSIKQLKLHSESSMKKTGFKNNEHVEDPRVCLHNEHWFLCYTDGWEVGIAKLDYNTCDTVYSHYLEKPVNMLFKDGDGREKNWLPISSGDELHIWYSDRPRTFLIYKDKQDFAQLQSYFSTKQEITCNYGKISGGCCPVPYDENTQIWFFHTRENGNYRIGAYITNKLRVIKILVSPIIIGQPIVFPCGAVQTDNGWMISMGVNDNRIGLLEVKREDLDKHFSDYI
jgi:predicted GH43/DUF377 family glycosyl hydrolase